MKARKLRCGSGHDDNVLSTWRAQVAKAANDSGLKVRLVMREHEILPRFAEHYEKLKSMPRRMRRSLQRRWKQSLAGVALLLALGQAPALAATINVGANCTLGQAITSANNNTSVGGCARGSGADRIVLPRNSTQTLTSVNNNHPRYGASGLPIVRSDITIDGNGSTLRRAPNAPRFRIFTVVRGDLSLQETTVTGGFAAREPGVLFSGKGGGIFNYLYSSTLTNCVISGNRAETDGGGVYNTDQLTGGYPNTVAIINSVISGNSTGGSGGGIGNDEYSTTTITDSTISGNTAAAEGGGVHNGFESFVSITRSTISGNTAATCGGAHNQFEAIARLFNSTVSGNTADGAGGGLCNKNRLYLTHSTVTRNAAGSNGGGVSNFDSYPAANLYLNRTLIAGNTGSGGREIHNITGAAIAAADFNASATVD